MKARKVIYCILMYLPIVCNLLSLPFLPDTIPAHFGVDNVVNRWGSKYEILILPVVTLIFGMIMIKVSHFNDKELNSSKNNERLSQIFSILALFVFNVINLYFLIISFKKITSLADLYFDINQLVFFMVGIVMIIIGSLMPKAKMNSIVGVRTKWSMKNETVWKKSQFFGGISFIVMGLFMIIISIVFEGIRLYVISIILLLLESFGCIYYTYRISKIPAK